LAYSWDWMLAFEQDAADALLVACALLVAGAVLVLPELAGVAAVLELMLEQAVSSPRPTAAAAASVLCRILFPSPASGSQRSPTFVDKL
jgi:hypothetical protein